MSGRPLVAHLPLPSGKLIPIYADPVSVNWQPIETAPKNGTPILGYMPATEFDSEEIEVIRWECTSYNTEPVWAYGYEDNEYGFRSNFGEPTHWMPLPEPPMAQEQAA